MHDSTDGIGVQNGARQVLSAASLSYRQLDYWTRKGYIKPRRQVIEHEGQEYVGKGSGYPRDYSDEEMAVAVRMARLVDRGFTPKAAARIARVTPGEVHLGQGIHLTVTEPTDPRDAI